MKKMISRFLKDTRGVVMMEYVVLGVFAVVVTVVGVMALGKAYTTELGVMAEATVGNTVIAEDMKLAVIDETNDDVTTSQGYATSINDQTDDAAPNFNDVLIHE